MRTLKSPGWFAWQNRLIKNIFSDREEKRREDRLIRSLPVACSVFKTNVLELETAMSVDQGVIKGTLSFPSYLGVKPGDEARQEAGLTPTLGLP